MQVGSLLGPHSTLLPTGLPLDNLEGLERTVHLFTRTPDFFPSFSLRVLVPECPVTMCATREQEDFPLHGVYIIARTITSSRFNTLALGRPFFSRGSVAALLGKALKGQSAGRASTFAPPFLQPKQGDPLIWPNQGYRSTVSTN